MVVLSTHTEHMQVPVHEKPPTAKRGRRAEKLHLKGVS
jgi:hypothetical protein